MDDAGFRRVRDAALSRIDELSEKLRRYDEILGAALIHEHGDGQLAVVAGGADSYYSGAGSGSLLQDRAGPVPAAASDDPAEYPIQWNEHHYLYNNNDDHGMIAGEATPVRFSDGGFGGVPASAAAIASLKKQRHDGSRADNMCVICMRHYKKRKRLYVMPCAFKHRFHRKCLTKWLSRSHLCPLCRHALPTEDQA